MTFAWKDRIKVTSTTTSTGALTLAASGVSGYQTFAAGDDGKTFNYVIEDGTAWETGTGVYTHSTLNFTRVLSASSTSSLLNLSGSETLFVDLIADEANRMSLATLTNVTGTDNDTSMVVGNMYIVDMGAWATANRTYTLPSTFAAGDRVGVCIRQGSTTGYELYVQAFSGDKINTLVNPAAFGQLNTGGECVIFRAVNADTEWVTEVDIHASGVVVQPGGRLTLTNAVPVTTTDVAAGGTVYYAPYVHNVVTLWDGNTWIPRYFSGLSQALTDSTKSPAAVSTSSNYDMFVWDDAGTTACTRGPAWTTNTIGSGARGTGAGTTELEMWQGRYVNKNAITNGPAARKGLYVGTIHTNASGAAVDDTYKHRQVWNYYNQYPKRLFVSVAGGSETSTSTTNQLVDNAGADSDPQVTLVHGQPNGTPLTLNLGTTWSISSTVATDISRSILWVNGLSATSWGSYDMCPAQTAAFVRVQGYNAVEFAIGTNTLSSSFNRQVGTGTITVSTAQIWGVNPC